MRWSRVSLPASALSAIADATMPGLQLLGACLLLCQVAEGIELLENGFVEDDGLAASFLAKPSPFGQVGPQLASVAPSRRVIHVVDEILVLVGVVG